MSENKSDNKSDNFMLGLCVGEIREDIFFPFPKMNATESETLKTMFDSMSSWLKGHANDFRKWDEKGEFPPEFIQEIREFGLFSLIVPEEFGGLGLSNTAYSRTLQEMAKYDGSLAVTVGAHSSIGMRGLVLFGTPEQKKKYMPKLATGEMIAAFCLTEPGSGSDAASIRTKATLEGDNWVLNGDKLWITNGGIADFFTVFARTDGADGKISAFIVTKDMPGIKIGTHEDKMGIRASSTTTVNFDNVKVPKENLLGEVGKGFKVAMTILNSGRTGLGGGAVGGIKKVIALATNQAKNRQQFGKPIAEFGLIKEKIGKMVVDCYAVESAVTMLAGLIDQGHKDYAVEAAITKVFGSEALWRSIDEGLQIAGGNGFMREFPYERMLRDARINRIYEGANEILRLFIALTAMNDAGTQLKEVASSLGNALVEPIKGFGILSEYAKRRFTHATGLGQATFTKAHPTIKPQCEVFQTLTQKLALATDRILRKHGKAIINKQFATKRLADIMIDMYVMACMISRVTASIEEKGLEKAAREVEILQIFVGQARSRVTHNFSRIDDNDDELIKDLAEDAYNSEGYRWDNL